MKTKGAKVSAQALAAEINQTLKLEEGVRLGSDNYFKLQRIPSGSLVVDRITGGGWALGRHYELFGDENAGKSTVAYRTMSLSQSRGNRCAIIDPEHSFDNERFDFLGGDSDSLLAFHPATGEDAVAAMMLLAKNADEYGVEVVTLDSIPSLVPGESMNKDPREEDRIGAQARMMSRALARITTVNKKTLFLWINQERVDVGVKFGNPRTTSGGRALRYYATGRIEFRRGARITEERQVASEAKLVAKKVGTGRWTQVRVEKDKSTIPYREGAFVFSNKLKNIDLAYEILQLGLEDGLIARSANGRYSYTDLEDHEWKGTEKTFTGWLRENEQLRAELQDVIVDVSTQQRGGHGQEDIPGL